MLHILFHINHLFLMWLLSAQLQAAAKSSWIRGMEKWLPCATSAVGLALFILRCFAFNSI